MSMVINYCLDDLDFDAAIGCITVAVALSLHTIDDVVVNDDLPMVVLTVAEHFAVCHASHYSLFNLHKKNLKNQEKKQKQQQITSKQIEKETEWTTFLIC